MGYLGTKPQTATQLADNIVTSDKIQAGAVGTTDIADGAVTGTKLENSGVTAGTYGSASAIPAVTVDAKGRVTSVTTNAFSAAPTTAQVLSATAGLTLGAVGTYATIAMLLNTVNTVTRGSTYSVGTGVNQIQSGLVYSVGAESGVVAQSGLSGTWRFLGATYSSGSSYTYIAGLAIRIA